MSDNGGHTPTDSADGPNGDWGSVLFRPGTDQIFTALSHRLRRVILLLLRRDSVVTMADVRDHAMAGEHGVEIELVHNHLPKLAAEDYIDWNRTTAEISKGPRFEKIEPLLDIIEDNADELPSQWP